MQYSQAMNSLTIKIPPDLEQELLQLGEHAHVSKSEVVRRALSAFMAQRRSATGLVSALDQAGNCGGVFCR